MRRSPSPGITLSYSMNFAVLLACSKAISYSLHFTPKASLDYARRSHGGFNLLVKHFTLRTQPITLLHQTVNLLTPL